MKTTAINKLKEMEKQGLIKLGKEKIPINFWKLQRPKDPKGLVLQALLKEREEGMGSCGRWTA